MKRIPRHIQEIIRLKGGNKYREGSSDKPRQPEPPEHQVPQHDWEDISDIKEEKPQFKPKPKPKPKPRQRAPKKAPAVAAKSAAGAALLLSSRYKSL